MSLTFTKYTSSYLRQQLGSIALLLCTITGYAQERTITGTVTSSEVGEPVPGVNVLVKGTTIGTVTNIDGDYRLQVPEDETTLQFSFIGYATQEATIGNQTTIDVVLESDLQSLEEVVVTAVGIEQSKRQLGYTIQEIDGESVAKANETNLVNALNSKVAGVNVYGSSGAPGASANIRIRGNTSITGSNSPLFVVDGIPINNDTYSSDAVGGVDQSNRAIDINPADIKNLTVLKGAAATVLYGIRAANGAIIITTKKGSYNTKPEVTVSSSWEVNEINRTLDLQTAYSQGRDGAYRGPLTQDLWSWGAPVADLEFDGNSDYPFDQNGDLVPAGEGNGMPARGYDVYDLFVRGLVSDNNISVRGGTESVTYYLSTGYLNNRGIIPNSEFDRVSLKSTLSAKITKKLTAGVSATYINSGGVRQERGSNLRGVMLGLIRNAPTFDLGNGKTGQEAADDPASYVLPNGIERSYRQGVYDNPYWVVNKNYSTDEVNRVFGYANLQYELFPSLNLSYKLGLDQYSDNRKARIGIVPTPGGGAYSPGEVDYDDVFQRDMNSDLILTFNKEINPNLYVDAIVGHNYFWQYYRRFGLDGNALSVPDFYHISNATPANAEEVIEEKKVNGVYAQANFGFRDFLYLNLSARNDWSSTLPEGENSFFYPAASLGFEFTEAFGISDNNILPYGKLRASYGQVGNDAPVYATASYYERTTVTGDGFTDGLFFPILGVNAFEQDGDLGNTALKPETTTTFEIGAELRLLQNRLGVDFTYYNSETTDQIIPVDISASSGFLRRVQNAGLVTNEGYEVVLTGSPVRTEAFQWDIVANFTQYENIVERISPDLTNISLSGFTSTSSRAIEGEPFGVLWGDRLQHVDDPNSPYDGQLIIGPEGFPVPAVEQGIIGDPNPDWLLGITNTFTYKGLALSALIDIRQGGDVWNGTYGIAQYFGRTQHSADFRGEAGEGVIIEGVVAEGDGYVPNTQQVDLNNDAIGSAANRWTRYGFGTLGEENVEDASWVRLRQVRLTYSLPQSLMDNVRGISGVDIALTGRNLLLFTGYKGIDPETNLTGTTQGQNGFGLEYFNNPNTRGYGVNLTVTF